MRCAELCAVEQGVHRVGFVVSAPQSRHGCGRLATSRVDVD
jgi:hypothetical protein